MNQPDILSSFILCLSYNFNVPRTRSEFGFERVGFRSEGFGSVRSWLCISYCGHSLFLSEFFFEFIYQRRLKIINIIIKILT